MIQASVDKDYCIWQNDIFKVMEKKGYTFDYITGTGVHPIFYIFKKTKQIGENRFKEFRLNIKVNNYEPNSNWFSSEYRLELKEYSKNENGHISNYWGKTPVVTADSFFHKDRTDYENLVKNLKYHHPY